MAPMWTSWFFHGTEAVWTTALFCAVIILPAMQMNYGKLVYAALFALLALFLIGTGIGIYNVVQAPRCPHCGALLPVDTIGYACSCLIEVTGRVFRGAA